MSKIDLSKAKVGDKFRTRCGFIRTYDEYVNYKSKNFYLLKDECGNKLYYHQYGEFLLDRESDFDLTEQVLDKPLDELIQEATKQIKENDDAIAEEKELQRRQEVVELAEKLVVNEEMMKSHRDLFEAEVHAGAKTITTYPAFVIRSAEDFIKYKNQYLKQGKL